MTNTIAKIRVNQPDPPDSAPPPRRRGQHWLLAMVVAFCGGVALLWIAAGVRSSGRGLNVADESFYLLSYRWWNVDHRNFTGAQYFYGPVFDLLGHDIARLRLFRLATMVLVHLVFGWSFMRWLRLHRPAAPPTRWWEAAGIAAVVAAGGVACGWLPLSPGYNDVILLGALSAMSLVLCVARHARAGRRIPLRLPVAYGTLLPLLLVTKWSSLTTVLLTAAAAAVALGRQPGRAVVRLAVGVTAGTMGVLTVMFLVVPMPAALAELAAVNRLMSGNTSPSTLLSRYAEELFQLCYSSVDRYLLLFVAAAVVVGVSWVPAIRMAAGVLAVLALGLSIQQTLATDGVHGGAGYAGSYARTLLVALLVVLWIGLLAVDGERVRQARWVAGRSRADTPPARSSLGTAGVRSTLLLTALALLPIVQALGTTGGLTIRAIGGFAAWMAVMIAVGTGLEAASALVRGMVAAVLAVTVLAAGSVAVGGLWRYPYRTFPYRTATVAAAGLPPLASIRLNRATADALSEMGRQLRPFVEPAGRAMIGVPALVVAFGGRPVGEPWVGVPSRVAAGIRADCRGGAPWWARRPPVLLAAEPVPETEIRALRACGIDFGTGYRLLATYQLPVEPGRTMAVQVFVPAAEYVPVAGYPVVRAGPAPRGGR